MMAKRRLFAIMMAKRRIISNHVFFAFGALSKNAYWYKEKISGTKKKFQGQEISMKTTPCICKFRVKLPAVLGALGHLGALLEIINVNVNQCKCFLEFIFVFKLKKEQVNTRHSEQGTNVSTPRPTSKRLKGRCGR